MGVNFVPGWLGRRLQNQRVFPKTKGVPPGFGFSKMRLLDRRAADRGWGLKPPARGSCVLIVAGLSAFWLDPCEGFALVHGGRLPRGKPCKAGAGNVLFTNAICIGSRNTAACGATRRPPPLRMSKEDECEGMFPLSQSMSINKALGTDKPEEMFRMTDEDGSGGLDFDEFSSVFGGLGMGMGYAEMCALFEEMDLNKDGVISLEEFKTRMETDLAMAQDAARDAKAAAFVAEQEADEVSGTDGDGPREELERTRIAAEEAQKRVEKVSKAVSKLGL